MQTGYFTGKIDEHAFNLILPVSIKQHPPRPPILPVNIFIFMKAGYKDFSLVKLISTNSKTDTLEKEEKVNESSKRFLRTKEVDAQLGKMLANIIYIFGLNYQTSVQEQVKFTASWLLDFIYVGKVGSNKRVVTTAFTWQKRKISYSNLPRGQKKQC